MNKVQLHMTKYLCLALLFASCQSHEMKPVEANTAAEESTAIVPNVFSTEGGEELAKEPVSTSGSQKSAHHHAVVQEVLSESKYSIVRVAEEGASRWLITRVQQVQEGDHVDYHEGLTKKDYRSTALDRTFDEVVLVSSFKVAHSSSDAHSEPVERTLVTAEVGGDIWSTSEFLEKGAGAEGQKVRVQGVVTKVNANIMKRHWIHLSESLQGTSDVVLTTQTVVPVGHEVVFEGVVVVNKDFGAGYVFELLLEDAVAL